MTVVVWIVEGTWSACVDAARVHAPADADITLLHVTPADIPGATHGAFAGLLGRGHPWGHRPAEGCGSDPGTRLEHLAAMSAEELLQAAADRLGRPCTRTERTGRVEREVVAVTEGGRPAHPGPRRRPHPPRPAQPGSRQPLRRRPRPVPTPAALARDSPRPRHHAAATGSSPAPPVRVGSDRGAVPPGRSTWSWAGGRVGAYGDDSSPCRSRWVVCREAWSATYSSRPEGPPCRSRPVPAFVQSSGCVGS